MRHTSFTVERESGFKNERGTRDKSEMLEAYTYKL